MKSIELLAPAKNAACGMAAIDAGADAVYIGATQFGAREAAGNSVDDIAALVRHAHTYWARVYATVNTLLSDEEIPQALRLIAQLYDAGVDGLIIQDAGLLECDLPPLPVIASTQMHNHTPEKVAFLEQVGVQRVILARELDLEQIRAIRRQTTVELECFVHGALCVCYSGQCYLSYALGGRSGNRGQCAQPCRKPYSLVDGQGKVLVRDKHLLSLRDLNLSAHLGDLLDAGVSAFKIEGRLKDRAYVTNVVSYYRAQLDAVLAERGLKKSSSGSSQIDVEPDVRKTFNRGYTSYFLHGKRGKVGYIKTPKMVGEEIGPVTAVSRQSVTVETTTPMHRGDGICFFTSQGELTGTMVNDVRGTTIVPAKFDGIEVGMTIYRNHDHDFLTRLESAHVERKIAVAFTMRETPHGITLRVRDEDGNTVEIDHPCEKVAANKPEAALATLQKQLHKCGGSDFACTDVTIDLREAYFFPVAVLNELRRGVLERLADVRNANYPQVRRKFVRTTVSYPERTLSYRGNVLNQQAVLFYRRHGVRKGEAAAESGLNLYGRQVMTTRYCLLHQFGLCLKEAKAAKLPLPLSLIDAEGNRLELHFDCARCGMNIYLGQKSE